MFKNAILLLFATIALTLSANAQKADSTAAKKSNKRPGVKEKVDPFAKADVKTMLAQCVKLETEEGAIELEMFPETAPETVRNFLNLAATEMFDTTTFSRVVPNFVIQGGNLATREKITQEVADRSRKTIPDEPNAVKHERGIISMARGDKANTASTHFFILIREAKELDGKFAAFGRVTNGMDVVDKINKMPVNEEKPVKPVRLTKATVAPCAVPVPKQ